MSSDEVRRKAFLEAEMAIRGVTRDVYDRSKQNDAAYEMMCRVWALFDKGGPLCWEGIRKNMVP